MWLQGIFDGRLYATDYRSILFERPASGFDPVGRLPDPTSGLASIRYRLLTSRGWKSVIERVVGSFPAVTLHRLTDDDLLATAGPWLFTSHDAGRQWRLRRRLPPSSGTSGVLPTGVCYHEGTVLVGEYPLDDGVRPRILRSDDRGRTWTVERVLDGVRHVHALQVDPYTGDRWITTGDADTECQIARFGDDGLEVIGGGSQRWRAVDLAFTPSAVLWGVDCVYAESNPILKLDRDSLADHDPSPTPVYRAADSVFYAATLSIGDAWWVVFSTAAEAMRDSTAPDAGNAGSGSVSVVAASSASRFTEWYELARYARRRRPVDRVNPGGKLPVAAAYAFLAADPQRGLFVNPSNTARDAGTIRRFPPAVFRRLDDQR